MSYALKGTGIPAAYTIKACLIVDDDNATIVDLKGNALTRDGAVTVSAGSWNSNTRRYFSTTGSSFSPQSIVWNSPPSLALGSGAGFSVFAAMHSVGAGGAGTARALLSAANGDSVNVVDDSSASKIAHKFASNQVAESSTLGQLTKLSLLARGIPSGAQSWRIGNHGSALSSAGSGSDSGFIPSTWAPQTVGGIASVNWVPLDCYCLLVIQGQLSDADADLLHTDWFAELIGASTTTTVTVTLVDAAGAPRTSLTGLKWAWFDQITPDLFATPTDKGSVETTDGSGSLVITLANSTKTNGQVGWLVVTDSDGTTTQSPAHKAFSGPCAVVVA